MKELKRSRTNRMVAGVCGGIGEYLDIDPNVIRLIWVVVTVLTGGVGILAYLLAWLIMPEDTSPATENGPIDTTAVSSMPAGAGTTIEIEPDQNR
ncbi:MAG: PspC domain-containing protein [Methanospirillum sp.]